MNKHCLLAKVKSLEIIFQGLYNLFTGTTIIQIGLMNYVASSCQGSSVTIGTNDW